MKMRQVNIRRYRGDGLPSDGNPSDIFPYLADEELVNAVNMSIVLTRPLLIKGPPGCGKTRLATSIAHELGLTLHEWFVKSTSRVKEGLYQIDILRREHDVRLQKNKAQKLCNYIKFGPLGDALRSENECVVLIDEIDKAHNEFPNDLLRELDEKKFTIEELDDYDLTDNFSGKKQGEKTFTAKQSPIIIITSNNEKALPDAFLRRCLFYAVDFPKKEQLIKIIQLNISEIPLNQELVRLAVERLIEIRKIGGYKKPPATSELIDWVRVLHHWNAKPEDLGTDKLLTDLPFWKVVLFKYQRDQQHLEQYVVENVFREAAKAA